MIELGVILLYLWFIGYLFAVGVLLNTAKTAPVFLAGLILLIVFWPVYLGVRYAD